MEVILLCRKNIKIYIWKFMRSINRWRRKRKRKRKWGIRLLRVNRRGEIRQLINSFLLVYNDQEQMIE